MNTSHHRCIINVNDKFVFRMKIDVSNTQLYFTFNIMLCIVELTAFPQKRRR